MTRLFPLLLALCFFALSAVAQPEVETEVAFENLRFERPLYLCHPGDGTDRVVVAEQSGRVFIFDNDADVAQDQMHEMIDLRDITIAPGHNGQNEEGLLGVAFHPDFADNGQVFLHYSAARPKRNVLSRFTVLDDGVTLDTDNEEVLFEIEQPFWNHNGGMIDFGPDGYLYLALGDGGAGGDPFGNGQKLSNLFSTIIRIDVDNTDDERGTAYAIPEDNPFLDNEEAKPEIYAYGLRNVWRFSFDRETGTLWAGDVGQGAWEEIDIIMPGRNYGWNIREGEHAYENNEPTDDIGPLVDPIVEHRRSEAISITGGYVYRGNAIPQIDGYYLYGDYGTGKLWMLNYDGRRIRAHHEIGRVQEPASFGEDRDGEVYICSFDGHIYKFVAGD